ncbi:cytokine-dependent hematopoietic cell linker isoform X3 [Symphalangus syndactylus]|uniref:cytokine-dependent hematopoietic cell linker isoform X3 n=1 Tax=Symphalangus syndactylus TaxID=9590 RepID=UPI003003E60A
MTFLRGNRRTTKEGSNDLKFQNFSLPKNRSWPHLNSATGQYQRINKPLLDWERNFAAVLDEAKGHSDDDYDDPELRMEETWQSIKILPARPIKESEYADTRYFKVAMDTPLPLDTRTSIPIGQQTWNTQTRWTNPFPRTSEAKTLKETHLQERTRFLYHLLGLSSHFRKSTSPCHLSRRAAGHLYLRDTPFRKSRECPVPHNQRKPESTHLLQNQNTQEIPLAISSSSFTTSNHSVQNRDHRGGMQPCSPQRCQPPASCSPHENISPYKYTSWRPPFPKRCDRKDVQHNEWYVGEYSRQAVEEAFMKENKDGTFLVRDCSTKSKEEPYVLVVFCENKVYNVKIRCLERNQQFALGTGLRGDEKFDSVEDIIEHYKNFPIILIDGKDKTGVHKKQCHLTHPLPLTRHLSPL